MASPQSKGEESMDRLSMHSDLARRKMINKSNIKESKADRPRTRRRRPQLEIQEPQEEQLGGRDAHRPPGNRNDFLRIFDAHQRDLQFWPPI